MAGERQVIFWLAAGFLALLGVLALREVILPFVVGLGVAYALNPLVDLLGERGVPRAWGSALIMAALMILVAALLVLIVPVLASQTQQLITQLPAEIERLRAMIESVAKERLGSHFGEFEAGLNAATAELSKNAGLIAGVLAQSAWTQGRALISLVSFALITPLVIFYLLADWKKLLDTIDNWLPRAQAPTIRRLGSQVNEAVAAFIRGQGLVCLILGLVYAVGLSAIGLRYGLLIGLATGVLSFVPFVGWASGLITSACLAIAQSWPNTTPLAMVLALFAFGQVLDAGFLSPRIVGAKIGLHPVWLIFALVVFSYVFGFVGVLVAVPVTAAVAVLVRYGLSLYLESPLYLGTVGSDAQASRGKSSDRPAP